jgi:hypothetical protein
MGKPSVLLKGNSRGESLGHLNELASGGIAVSERREFRGTPEFCSLTLLNSCTAPEKQTKVRL